MEVVKTYPSLERCFSFFEVEVDTCGPGPFPSLASLRHLCAFAFALAAGFGLGWATVRRRRRGRRVNALGLDGCRRQGRRLGGRLNLSGQSVYVMLTSETRRGELTWTWAFECLCLLLDLELEGLSMKTQSMTRRRRFCGGVLEDVLALALGSFSTSVAEEAWNFITIGGRILT